MNWEYSVREASGGIRRTSIPGTFCVRSVSSSDRAKRIRAADMSSALRASAGLAVSTQQSVTVGRSSIGGSGSVGDGDDGDGLRHPRRRGQLVPKEDAKAD